MTDDDIKDALKRVSVKEALAKLSYLDLQMMWRFVETVWRFKIVKVGVFYDIDETLKWETLERSYREYEKEEHEWCDWHEPHEEDIYPQPRTKGKVKGRTFEGRPALARPGTVKGNKRR